MSWNEARGVSWNPEVGRSKVMGGGKQSPNCCPRPDSRKIGRNRAKKGQKRSKIARNRRKNADRKNPRLAVLAGDGANFEALGVSGIPAPGRFPGGGDVRRRWALDPLERAASGRVAGATKRSERGKEQVLLTVTRKDLNGDHAAGGPRPHGNNLEEPHAAPWRRCRTAAGVVRSGGRWLAVHPLCSGHPLQLPGCLARGEEKRGRRRVHRRKPDRSATTPLEMTLG